MSWLRKILSPSGTVQPAFTAPLAPVQPFFAIGDIHGEFQLLDALLTQIGTLEQSAPVICVGDYVDRGESSARVLNRIKHLNEIYPDNFQCLKGNHEQMLLAFIDAPEEQGERWLRVGGLQTLASYGIGRQAGESMSSFRDTLVDRMGQEMINWLRMLPLTWETGNVVVTHAGADPSLPIDLQTDQTLLWGHPDFERMPRQDGIWIVHGHTIVDSPTVENGRIAVDTGAYATRCLTAAHVTDDGVTFLSS